MRCNECRVDLEDNHKNCPLCGCKTVISKQKIVLQTAPYPELSPAEALNSIK